jgi:hypothetical protein
VFHFDFFMKHSCSADMVRIGDVGRPCGSPLL